MNERPELTEAYRRLLTWFAQRHPRGSQTSHWERWLLRAVEETLELGLAANLSEEALRNLRERGFIETRDGTGSFLGAKVTTITERGYRLLDRLNGQSIYDADVLAAAVQALIATLRESAETNAGQISQLQAVVEDLHSKSDISGRVVSGLSAVASTIQTAGASAAAWNALVAVASAAGVHGLSPVVVP